MQLEKVGSLKIYFILPEHYNVMDNKLPAFLPLILVDSQNVVEVIEEIASTHFDNFGSKGAIKMNHIFPNRRITER